MDGGSRVLKRHLLVFVSSGERFSDGNGDGVLLLLLGSYVGLAQQSLRWGEEDG